ncbi:MAG: HPF/RaiA family ribosome-associated protein [Kofleriaceae bacterium]
MQAPLDITFQGMTSSVPVEAAITRWAARLDHAFEDIESCSVVVEQPWHGAGRDYLVKIELGVLADTIEVPNDLRTGQGHRDIYVAVADAFRAALRKLRDRMPIGARQCRV